MTYSEFLDILAPYAEDSFALFQKRLIITERRVMGVRTPTLRKIAKQYASHIDEVFSFPDEYYEIAFIKLTMASGLPYERFLEYLDRCIALMDNWALCDCFKANCIKRRKDDFLPVLQKLFQKGGEYEQRYPLVVLLSEYMEEKYLPFIENCLAQANTEYYYVHMATAWLIAEVLVKEYSFGVRLLQKKLVDAKTHNKAIQKAIESYRLSQEQKEYLRSLKIKKKN